MRELTFDEMSHVSGAGDQFLDDAIKFGSAIGSAIGAYSNVSATGAITGEALVYGGLGGMAGAGVGAAGWVGYQIGTLINEYTPIQSIITNLISSKLGSGRTDELNEILDMFFSK